MNLIITKINESAKIPFKKREDDAGYDLYWAPNEDEILIETLYLEDKEYKKCKMIAPGESVVLNTGLKVNFPKHYVLEIKNRSGIASSKQLLVGACIIDSSYTGEIFVNLHNVSKTPKVIEKGERIAQFVVYVVEPVSFVEIDNEQYSKEIISDRGDNGFGSSGKF